MKALTALALLTPLAVAEPLMHEVAKVAERPAGAPSYDDVCFRYGWIRKSEFPTAEDAKQAIRAFHATRVDWFYTGSHTMQEGATYVTPEAKSFIDWCHAQGMKVCGTINNNTTNKDWAYRKHHLTRFVGEVNNEDFRKMVIAWGQAQIDAGVDTMVCDDIFKYDKARQDLWSKEVLAKIIAHKPGFSMAGNSGHSISTEYVKRFAVNYHYSDNNFIPSPGQLWQAARAHRAEKSAFLMQPNRPRTVDQQRAMIALGYAVGAHLIAPWDAYIHGGKRLFSEPKDYADLYGFARALGQAGLLKEYEDAAVGGFDLKEDRYGSLAPIAIRGGSGKLSAFGRAKPGDPDAPLVIHLVDSAAGKAATLELIRDCASQLGADSLKCELLTPPAYHQATHQRAGT
ncbi:MAG: hypothetical protein KJO79_05520, partial [Verrucomicrobiae bacterium]|nr:hypothetical protein [Verrucomicrobiae bacterium]NNJ86620.1 hypothetical protein [Akkermansiaceae bacterium]